MNQIDLNLTIYPVYSLGIVEKCTLTGYVNNFTVDGRSYCFVDRGNSKHYEAIETCRQLNARLPLPRNKRELDAFRKASSQATHWVSLSSWTHVDARNPMKTDNKSEWVDAEDKPLGDTPVYLGVIEFFLKSYLKF